MASPFCFWRLRLVRRSASAVVNTVNCAIVRVESARVNCCSFLNLNENFLLDTRIRAAVPPPPPPGGGNNARDARAARRAAREQADQQEGGYWGDWT